MFQSGEEIPMPQGRPASEERWRRIAYDCGVLTHLPPLPALPLL
jgi:hypothetical protein